MLKCRYVTAKTNLFCGTVAKEISIDTIEPWFSKKEKEKEKKAL